MKNADGTCVLCGAPEAGVEHIWWECPALNGVQRRAKEGNIPAYFWMAGIVPSDWTTWPDTENMKAMEVCHPCKGKMKVNIDGSATK
eukprot:8553977-Heterocapsa_arctica.AAC.2